MRCNCQVIFSKNIEAVEILFVDCRPIRIIKISSDISALFILILLQQVNKRKCTEAVIAAGFNLYPAL